MTDPIPVKAPPPSPVAPRQTPDDTFGKRGRLLALISAGTDGTDSERCLDEVHRKGWTPLVNRAMDVLPWVDGFILKNPGGVLHNESMQATQFAQAKRAGLSWILRDWSKWLRVCDLYRSLGKDPIAYIGGWLDDKLIHSTPPEGQAALFVESFKEITDAGFSYGIDKFHKLTPQNRTAALSWLTRLRTYSKHTRLWVEPCPMDTDAWANDYKVGAMISNWNASFKFPTSRASDILPAFKGEIIVHIDDDRDANGVERGWTDPQWILDDLRKCHELGYSAAVPTTTGLRWEDMRAALNGVKA